jgi:hypothetical protein
MQERFRAVGALALCGGAPALEKVVSEDYERWGRVIKAAHISAEQ